MTPGTIVEVTSGPWQGRIGTVEEWDPAWASRAAGAVLIRLHPLRYSDAAWRRPAVERVAIEHAELALVDLRVREVAR